LLGGKLNIWNLLACLNGMPIEESKVVAQEPINVEIPTIVHNWSEYPFLTSSEGVYSLQELFPTPKDYKRRPVENNSFASWLRNLPVLDRQEVYSFKGNKLSSPAAAVVPIDVGSGDVQQCADSILRLYSEYRWSNDTAIEWGMHFTSGDITNWKDWKEGERFRISGSSVQRIRTKTKDNTYKQYKKWMHHAFLYAGTRSLNMDATFVPYDEEILPGDFFVHAGSPGHAILVLDIAVADGKPPIALLGQGFMPAQEFHVVREVKQGNWFVLPTSEGGVLHNPSWYPLPRSGLYRFP
jgi:hypothetical protein